jgi:hypothetical protein
LKDAKELIRNMNLFLIYKNINVKHPIIDLDEPDSNPMLDELYSSLVNMPVILFLGTTESSHFKMKNMSLVPSKIFTLHILINDFTNRRFLLAKTRIPNEMDVNLVGNIANSFKMKKSDENEFTLEHQQLNLIKIFRKGQKPITKPYYLKGSNISVGQLAISKMSGTGPSLLGHVVIGGIQNEFIDEEYKLKMSLSIKMTSYKNPIYQTRERFICPKSSVMFNQSSKNTRMRPFEEDIQEKSKNCW